METLILPLGPIEANCILAWQSPAHTWIIDPGYDAPAVIDALQSRGLTPDAVFLTHGHFDHISGVTDLLCHFPTLPVFIHADAVPLAFDALNHWAPYPATVRPATLDTTLLVDGATITRGGLTARIMHTPGHTPGSVCFYFPDAALLLSGDTLFRGSIGRTDFPGGSMSRMRASLATLVKLPPETRVIPGHGDATTIGDEIRDNPYLK